MVTIFTAPPRPGKDVQVEKQETPSSGADPSTSSDSSLLILRRTDVDRILSNLDPNEAIASQSRVFSAFSGSQGSSPSAASAGSGADTSSIPIQSPQRLALTSAQCTTLFMPSQVPPTGAGIKIVSLPSAGDGGLPASTLLLDSQGRVKALVNARKLTALRNAAGSALFVQTFPSREPPTNLLIFGSGAQAYAHAVIFLKVFSSLKTLTIVARRRSSRADELVSTLRAEFPNSTIKLGISDPSMTSTSEQSTTEDKDSFNLSQTVHNANIILTLTPSLVPLFNTVDVTSHTRLVLIGSYKPTMREVSDDLIHRAGRVVVDTQEGCMKEAGEIISSGVAQKGGIVELGLCLGDGEEAAKERRRVEEAGDIVLYKSVGIGIQDIAIADLILRQAQAQGLGTTVPQYD